MRCRGVCTRAEMVAVRRRLEAVALPRHSPPLAPGRQPWARAVSAVADRAPCAAAHRPRCKRVAAPDGLKPRTDVGRDAAHAPMRMQPRHTLGRSLRREARAVCGILGARPGAACAHEHELVRALQTTIVRVREKLQAVDPACRGRVHQHRDLLVALVAIATTTPAEQCHSRVSVAREGRRAPDIDVEAAATEHIVPRTGVLFERRAGAVRHLDPRMICRRRERRAKFSRAAREVERTRQRRVHVEVTVRQAPAIHLEWT